MPARKAPATKHSNAPALESIDFSDHWRSTSDGEQVIGHVADVRVIGFGSLKGGDAGVVVRHLKTGRYSIIINNEEIALDDDSTESFLRKARSGHHGGAGRGQGAKSRDGFSYTRRYSVTVPAKVVDVLARLGGGVVSLGARLAAKRTRAKLIREIGEVVDLCPAINDPVNIVAPSGNGNKMVCVYLDHRSFDFFRCIGGSNLSRGIRYAACLLDGMVTLPAKNDKGFALS